METQDLFTVEQDVPYSFTLEQSIGTFTVLAPHEVTQYYEYAAWYRTHKIEPGIYTVFAKPNGHGQNSYAVVLKSVITKACLQSGFGGVGYGEDTAGKREIGKQDTYTLRYGAPYHYHETTPPFEAIEWGKFHRYVL
jgi:hypothetical protein